MNVLIPMNRCETLIAGVNDMSTTDLIADALNKIETAASAVSQGTGEGVFAR